MKFITQLTALLLFAASCGPAPATVAPPPNETANPTSMDEMIHPSATPGDALPATIVPPPGEISQEGGQELAVIQRLYDHYFPDPLILVQNQPATLYTVTDGIEHVNQWRIGPFANASEMRPGQVFTFAFSPDSAGAFEIFNVGHNFSGELLVASNCAEAEQLRMDQGVQAFAIIHSPADGRIFPDTITVKVGLPVTLYHFSITGVHQVSVETLAPFPIGVGLNEIAQMQFTPEQVGEYAILHADDDLAGLLVVSESACPDV